MIPTFLIICVIAVSSCTEAGKKIRQMEDQKQKLKMLFAEWQLKEVTAGRLWAKDSCYPGWFADHPFDGTLSDMWGVADSSENAYTYSYADVNADGVLDQLVTFTPSQCDGGNASMWIQMQVFTVSKNGSYVTSSTIGDGVFAAAGQDTAGFYWYDSIGVNRIYATFYNFGKDDGHCCPHIVQPIVLAYDSKKIIPTGEDTTGQH